MSRVPPNRCSLPTTRSRMKADELVDRFRRLIRERLSGKTAWGRRQVLTEIEAALTDAAMGREPAEELKE